jgi:hypothetical protein
MKRTMNDEYGDGSDHEVCEVCGSCIPCDHLKGVDGQVVCPSSPQELSRRQVGNDPISRDGRL